MTDPEFDKGKERLISKDLLFSEEYEKKQEEIDCKRVK